MKPGKRIGWRRRKSPLAEVLLAPFLALLYSIPAFIVGIILLFVFGLICGSIEPLGNAVDEFFNSLPFWNDKWEYAWVLYFGIAFGIITEIICTLLFIYWSFSKYEPVSTNDELEQEQRNTAAAAEEIRWNNLSTDEKWEEVIREQQQMREWDERDAQRRRDAFKREVDRLEHEAFNYHYDLMRDLSYIEEELESLDR